VIRTIALALALCAALVAAHDPASAQAKPDPQNTIILTTSAPALLPRKLNTIRDVFGAVRTCFVAGAPFNDSPQEFATTIRFSFTRDGHILGQPRFTYVQAGISADAKQVLKQVIGHALIACTSLSFTNGLGGAIAGRPFSIRIVKEPKAPSGVEHELTPGRHPH
jgi:hypothetical protein